MLREPATWHISRSEKRDLKVAGGACHTHCGLVTNDLRAHHCHCFTLGGVDFTRHDTAARLILRQTEFAETTAGSRSKQTNIVGNLHQRARENVQSAMRLHNRIVRGQCFKLGSTVSIGMTNKKCNGMSTLLGAVTKSNLVMLEISSAMSSAKPLRVLMPFIST